MKIMEHLTKIHISHPCFETQTHGGGLGRREEKVWCPQCFVEAARCSVKHYSDIRVAFRNGKEMNGVGNVTGLEVVPPHHDIKL